MRLILEGPDNAGKTSLANRLVESLGSNLLCYFHPGGKPEGAYGESRCIEEQYDLLRGHFSGSIVLDRITAISQTVYNPDHILDAVRMSALQAILDLKPVIIYCRPSTDRLLRMQDLTWRDGESEEHKQKIIENQHLFVERYDAMFRDIPCVSYDYDDEPHRELIYKKLFNACYGSVDDVEWFQKLMYYRSCI